MPEDERDMAVKKRMEVWDYVITFDRQRWMCFLSFEISTNDLTNCAKHITYLIFKYLFHRDIITEKEFVENWLKRTYSDKETRKSLIEQGKV